MLRANRYRQHLCVNTNGLERRTDDSLLNITTCHIESAICGRSIDGAKSAMRNPRTRSICCEQDVANISAPKAKHIGWLLARDVLGQGQSRRIAGGIEEGDEIYGGGSEHDEDL